MSLIIEGQYSLLYLSKLSLRPSQGLIKSSFSKTNPETKISTPSLCKQKFNKKLISKKNQVQMYCLTYKKGGTKFIQMHTETQFITQFKQTKSQENRNMKDLKTYALVMVFSNSLEFKLINSPNSPSHFASSKSSSCSWKK